MTSYGTYTYPYEANGNGKLRYVDSNTNGAGANGSVHTNFALLDGEVYLKFTGSTLTHRYMSGPAIDINLAIEEVSSVDVVWALTDHQGTVRDAIDGSGAVVNHIHYSCVWLADLSTSTATRPLLSRGVCCKNVI